MQRIWISIFFALLLCGCARYEIIDKNASSQSFCDSIRHFVRHAGDESLEAICFAADEENLLVEYAGDLICVNDSTIWRYSTSDGKEIFSIGLPLGHSTFNDATLVGSMLLVSTDKAVMAVDLKTEPAKTCAMPFLPIGEVSSLTFVDGVLYLLINNDIYSVTDLSNSDTAFVASIVYDTPARLCSAGDQIIIASHYVCTLKNGIVTPVDKDRMNLSDPLSSRIIQAENATYLVDRALDEAYKLKP